jgi:hypothetical protein
MSATLLTRDDWPLTLAPMPSAGDNLVLLGSVEATLALALLNKVMCEPMHVLTSVGTCRSRSSG